MRAGSRWPHVGHLLVAIIRFPPLVQYRPSQCRPLPPVVQDCAHAARSYQIAVVNDSKKFSNGRFEKPFGRFNRWIATLHGIKADPTELVAQVHPGLKNITRITGQTGGLGPQRTF